MAIKMLPSGAMLSVLGVENDGVCLLKLTSNSPLTDNRATPPLL